MCQAVPVPVSGISIECTLLLSLAEAYVISFSCVTTAHALFPFSAIDGTFRGSRQTQCSLLTSAHIAMEGQRRAYRRSHGRFGTVPCLLSLSIMPNEDLKADLSVQPHEVVSLLFLIRKSQSPILVVRQRTLAVI